MLVINYSVAEQQYNSSVPSDCEVPLTESKCLKVISPSGISICGAYRHPWPTCPQFCWDFLIQRLYHKSCVEKIPSFELTQKLRGECVNACHNVTSADTYFWDNINSGFILSVNASDLTPDAEVQVDSTYIEAPEKAKGPASAEPVVVESPTMGIDESPEEEEESGTAEPVPPEPSKTDIAAFPEDYIASSPEKEVAAPEDQLISAASCSAYACYLCKVYGATCASCCP